MSSYCPKCESPIKDGEHIRGSYLAVYRQESEVSHGVSVYKEEYIEHLNCPYYKKEELDD